MSKKETLDYLSEKKRLTAPVATAEDNVRAAEWNYVSFFDSFYWVFPVRRP